MAPSEAVLQGGQHATFRLVVRVTAEDGRPLPVRPAVSEKFQVAARRNRPPKQCGVSAPACGPHFSQQKCICCEHETQAGCSRHPRFQTFCAAWGLSIGDAAACMWDRPATPCVACAWRVPLPICCESTQMPLSPSSDQPHTQ